VQPVKLHLGCGPHIFPDWINYDIEPGPGGVRVDLRKRLPLDDASVDFAFSEHFLEHVSRADGVAFLREVARVLKPAGVLRLSTPSLAYVARKYLDASLISLPGVWEPKTPAQMLNGALREWGHEFVYDLPELFAVLGEAGFTKFESRDWRSSNHAPFRDREVRPYHHELILEAQK
jgi:predicted SAM-dependent methyltransferase